MDKIKKIYTNGKQVDVKWGNNVEEIEYSNAVVMAAVISRGGYTKAEDDTLRYIIKLTEPTILSFYFSADHGLSQDYKMVVDWGDGTRDTVQYPDPDMSRRPLWFHDYAAGTYTITVTDYEYGHLGMNTGDIAQYLVEIKGALPKIIAVNNESNTNFTYYFGYLKYSNNSPITVSGNLFKNNTQIESLRECFNGTQFTMFPADLLKGLVNLKNIGYAFQNSNITEISLGFFNDCAQLENIEYCFLNNPIKKIPTKLFSNIRSEFCNIDCVFMGCPIEEIPDDLFNGCTASLQDGEGSSPFIVSTYTVTRIGDRMFYGCTFTQGLPLIYTADNAVIGDEMYAYTTSTGIMDLWYGNYYTSNIGLFGASKIGNGMFRGAKITNDRGLYSIFSPLRSLQEIGDYTFRDCDAVSAEQAFASSPIKTIGRGTFLNSKINNFRSTFTFCTSLTAIPPDTFDGCVNANNFSYCFEHCASLTGEAPRLWEMYPNADGTGCFRGCTNLSNYSDIPADWK